MAHHRKFNYDNNGNAHFYPQQQSAKDYLNLPHINEQRINNQANQRIIAKQTAKKMIKVFTAIDYPVF